MGEGVIMALNYINFKWFFRSNLPCKALDNVIGLMHTAGLSATFLEVSMCNLSQLIPNISKPKLCREPMLT